MRPSASSFNVSACITLDKHSLVRVRVKTIILAETTAGILLLEFMAWEHCMLEATSKHLAVAGYPAAVHHGRADISWRSAERSHRKAGVVKLEQYSRIVRTSLEQHCKQIGGSGHNHQIHDADLPHQECLLRYTLKLRAFS